MSSALFDRLAAAARQTAAAAAYETTLNTVARRRELPLDALRRLAARPVAAARGRQEAVYLAVTHFGIGVRAVARVSGLSAPKCSRACKAVESRRDDAGYDRELDEMQLELMA
jgi:hypothetical protein